MVLILSAIAASVLVSPWYYAWNNCGAFKRFVGEAATTEPHFSCLGYYGSIHYLYVEKAAEDKFDKWLKRPVDIHPATASGKR